MKKYTIATTFCWTLWIVFCIADSNFLVTTVLFRFEAFSLSVFIKDQLFTLVLGFVITPLFILIHYNFILKQQISELFQIMPQSQEKEALDEIILFQSEYKNDSLSLNLHCILFIKSADNYIDVYYLQNDHVAHKLIRNNLSAVEQKTLHPDLMRCHRSFIVNKQKIMSVEGNSSGYNIVLNGYSHKIPLSKKYKEALRSENK
jgi:DNA-binding LytR/AlgR family response regulator